MVAQWYDLRDTGDPSSNPVGQAAAERSHDYPIDVPAATPTLSNANLRYQETLNGQKDSDAASFTASESCWRLAAGRPGRTDK